MKEMEEKKQKKCIVFHKFATQKKKRDEEGKQVYVCKHRCKRPIHK